MIHKMRLKPQPFHAVKAGYKTIELRLNDEKRRLLKTGDYIEFTLIGNPDEKITKKITALHEFPDFAEMYRNLPLLKCGYTPFTLHEAVPERMELYYSKSEQQKYNVLGIELEEEKFQKYLSGQTGEIPDCSGYEKALQEIRSGLKSTHWIWYVFPQIKGLSVDVVTEYYALDNIDDAREYIEHNVLGKRLLEITSELLKLDISDPVVIFGMTDALKLRSCMTIFDYVSPENTVFREVIDKFCLGVPDENTLDIIEKL